MITADHHGYVTSINRSFEEAYGWTAADLVGQPLPTIIPRRFHDAHHTGFARFLTTGTPTLLGQPLPLAVMTKDGRELVAEHVIVATEAGDHWEFGAIIRPPA
ncbi:MAG TPA: PAS domain S-box protein [Patescibacteria group bacterium]|nr:PAS domain S-box protein [Patescibacteria group bacterium]